MLTLWTDFDRSFDSVDSMLRRFDRFFEQGFPRGGILDATRDSRLVETENEVVLTADLPGVRAEDVEINVHDGTLTVEANRTPAAPEGYEASRLERPELRIAQTYSLPAPVDPERASASLTNGVLTVRLEKAPDARPRRIAVRS